MKIVPLWVWYLFVVTLISVHVTNQEVYLYLEVRLGQAQSKFLSQVMLNDDNE